MKLCQSCNKEFKALNNSRRKFCYECSPFGTKDKRNPTERAKDLDGKRVCYTCKERKLLDQFTIKRSEKTGYSWLCKSCNSRRTILNQQAVKVKCLSYKGGKCEICGYDKCARSLHFHHKDPTQKDFSIGTYRSRSWETIKEELDKCMLLCANCHGEQHD